MKQIKKNKIKTNKNTSNTSNTTTNTTTNNNTTKNKNNNNTTTTTNNKNNQEISENISKKVNRWDDEDILENLLKSSEELNNKIKKSLKNIIINNDINDDIEDDEIINIPSYNADYTNTNTHNHNHYTTHTHTNYNTHTNNSNINNNNQNYYQLYPLKEEIISNNMILNENNILTDISQQQQEFEQGVQQQEEQFEQENNQKELIHYIIDPKLRHPIIRKVNFETGEGILEELEQEIKQTVSTAIDVCARTLDNSKPIKVTKKKTNLSEREIKNKEKSYLKSIQKVRNQEIASLELLNPKLSNLNEKHTYYLQKLLEHQQNSLSLLQNSHLNSNILVPSTNMITNQQISLQQQQNQVQQYPVETIVNLKPPDGHLYCKRNPSVKYCTCCNLNHKNGSLDNIPQQSQYTYYEEYDTEAHSNNDNNVNNVNVNPVKNSNLSINLNVQSNSKLHELPVITSPEPNWHNNQHDADIVQTQLSSHPLPNVPIGISQKKLLKIAKERNIRLNTYDSHSGLFGFDKLQYREDKLDYYRNLNAMKKNEMERELKEIRYEMELAKKNVERAKQKQREDLLLKIQEQQEYQGNSKLTNKPQKKKLPQKGSKKIPQKKPKKKNSSSSSSSSASTSSHNNTNINNNTAWNIFKNGLKNLKNNQNNSHPVEINLSEKDSSNMIEKSFNSINVPSLPITATMLSMLPEPTAAQIYSSRLPYTNHNITNDNHVHNNINNINDYNTESLQDETLTSRSAPIQPTPPSYPIPTAQRFQRSKYV